MINATGWGMTQVLNQRVSELTNEVAALKSILTSIIEEIEMDFTPEELEIGKDTGVSNVLKAVYTHAKMGLK